MPKPSPSLALTQRAATHLRLLAATAESATDLADLVEECLAWSEGARPDPLAASTNVGRTQLGLADTLTRLRDFAPDAWPEALSELRSGLPELWQAAHEDEQVFDA